MASSLCVLSSATVRRRIPVVRSGIYVLTFGVSNLFSYPAVSSSLSALRTGYAQSLPLLSRFRSCGVGRSSVVEALQSAIMEGGSAAVVESIVVYVTVLNKEAGKKLAESIINERLAACVNRTIDTTQIVNAGIESVYHWQGKIETDSEELLIIKTRKSLLEPLTQHVKANHEYEVLEVIALPILGGNDKYLEWMKGSTQD